MKISIVRFKKQNLINRLDSEPHKHVAIHYFYGPVPQFAIMEVARIVIEYSANGANKSFRFAKDDVLERIENFHRSAVNECPMFSQSWFADTIDFWESCFVEFKIFDTIEEAQRAINRYREKHNI
jgi:hypothetical protein